MGHIFKSKEDSLKYYANAANEADSSKQRHIMDSIALAKAKNSKMNAISDSALAAKKNKSKNQNKGFWERAPLSEYVWGGIYSVTAVGVLLFVFILFLFKRRKKKYRENEPVK